MKALDGEVEMELHRKTPRVKNEVILKVATIVRLFIRSELFRLDMLNVGTQARMKNGSYIIK